MQQRGLAGPEPFDGNLVDSVQKGGVGWLTGRAMNPQARC